MCSGRNTTGLTRCPPSPLGGQLEDWGLGGGSAKTGGGSDDCEHEFGGIREKDDKPSALDVQQGVARRTGTKTSTFNALSKANTAGDKDIYTNEITATLKRK